MRRALVFSWLLASLLEPSSLNGDLFWKVAAEAPQAPQTVVICGDDRRTLAFGWSGAWEFDGSRWVKVHLLLDGEEEVPGRVVFAGGRFFAVSYSTCERRLRLHVLDGSTWRPFADFPGPVASYAFGLDRLFLTVGAFGACNDGACPPDPSKWGGLISISLADVSARAEAAPPACSGDLYVVKGKLHLLATPPSCGGVCFTTESRHRVDNSGTPLFRLDPSGWTALPPAGVPSEPPLEYPQWQATPSTLWAVCLVSETQSVAQVFDGERWSKTFSLPPVYGHPVEWNGQVLWVSWANRDSLYRLQGDGLVPFVPSSPYRRPVALFSAGSRLFVESEGNPVSLLASGEWRETSGIDEEPKSSIYLSDGKALFTLMGGNVLERSGGWKRLPPPGQSEVTGGFVYQGRVGVTDVTSWPIFRLLLYSAESGQWEDLGFPSTAQPDAPDPKILQVGDDLFVTGRVDEVYRYRRGGWSRIAGTRDDSSPRLRHLRAVAGQLWMVGDARTNRVEEDRLTPAFVGLPESWNLRDVAEIQGATFLVVDPEGVPADRNRPVVVELAGDAVRVVMRASDVGDLWIPYVDELQLETFAGRLFVGWDQWWHWMEISRGRLIALRGGASVRVLSSQGGFGTTHDNLAMYGPGNLLRPVERVRKTIPAIVDAMGLGGKYRSTLFLGNFSADRTATVRLFAGPDLVPAREVSLLPGTQTRLDDIVPGFVGPLTVDFDGLADDDDGWAAVRIWNEADGGTAGVALEAQDAGTFVLEQAKLLLPNPRGGTRSHLAAAAGSDGGRELVRASANSPQRYDSVWVDFTTPSGGFVQVDPDVRFADGPVTFYSGQGSDDLLPYSVRNDDRTQDGVVVQAGPRWLKPGRGTLFVPAALAVSTDKGSFRTEMAFASADLWTDTHLTFQFRGGSGGKAVDSTARVTIPTTLALRVDDVGSWLASNGVPVDPDGFDGTITVDSDLGAGAANLIGYGAVLGRGPSAQGDYSISVPIFPEAAWASTEAVVPGLLENAAFRSNLAVANPEPSGGPSVTLSMTIRDDTGLVAGRLPSITLQPGERRQLNQVLKLAGAVSSGWVELRRISGAGRFVAYSVINDNSTGDGTVFRMVRAR